MMSRFAAFSTAFALALAVAACGDSGDSADDAAQTPDSTWVDPDAPAGISVTDGMLTLPAVSGNPGAVYFTILNEGDSDEAIRSVWVNGAEMAMLHQTSMASGTAMMQDMSEVAVPAGETVSFAPGGLHAMAMGLSDHLEEGGETEVTLTFASGDKVSFPVKIVAAGGRRDSGN